MKTTKSNYKSFEASWNQLASAQKSSEVALPYTLYINRPLGRVLAVIGHKLNVKPDFISILSILITVFGLCFLVLRGYENLLQSLLGIFILLIGFGLDSADGQLARLTDLKSSAGEWLDHVLDSIKIPLFHISIVIVIMQTNTVSNIGIFLYLLIGVFASARFFSTEIKEKIMSSFGKKNKGMGVLRDLVLMPFDYGIQCFLFLLVPLNIILEGYAIWGGAFILFSILSFIRSYLQLKNI